MVRGVMFALTAVLAAAQQPNVKEEELTKPGEAQPAQQQQAAPAPAQQQAQAPAQQAAPAQQPSQPTARRQPAALHTPAPEETERRKQGKPVAAFWVVVPGK